MKKHFLRILTVMLMACLGIGVMAACGKKEDPPVTYTVAFSLGEGEANHAADGVTAPAPQTGKKVGDTITLTDTLQAEENWKFDGWSAKSGKVDGTTYTVKAADAVDGTITLTAQWAEDTPAQVTVTYSLGSCGDTPYAGTTTLPDSVTVNAGGSVTLPDKPVWEGYTFLGWKVGNDTKDAKAEITVSESITVTAQWKQVTYTVKFNLGSGGDSDDDVTITQKAAGSKVNIPQVKTYKGYELTGWQLQDKETTLEKDATEYTVAASDAATVMGADSEIVFIAQYNYITYTVKFDVDSGKPAGVDAAVQGTHTDATVTVEDMLHRRVTFPSVSLEGYVVTGWKLSTTQETKTGATYQVKDTDLPENTAAHEITFIAQWGEPDYTGVWTDYIINGYKVGSDKYDLYFEITIQSDEANGFDVVWKEYYTDDDFVDHATYVFGNFKKEGSSYKMTAEGTTYTLQVNANYQLVLGKTFTEGDPFNATLEGDHDPLPAVRITEPAAGTYYVRYTRSDYTETKYTFAAEGNDTIKTSASGSEIVISYKAVGSYLVISGDGVATHALYKNGNLYYTTLLNNDETDAQLTTEEPPLTPETADITFEFTSNPNRSGVKPQGMPAEDFTGTHRVGQSFNLPNAPTDENGAREFVWWETANGDHYAAGASYEVKAADAEAVMGDGFNPQVVGYKIVFTAEWTMTYKVEYISLTEDGTKDTAVSCGTDPETYKTNQPISIIEDEPTKGDATFLGWKLYLYNADQETYTPVRAVADILYKKDTDHATYTPNNSENKNAEKEPVTLTFVAQWEDAEEPATDINGVWSSEDYILTVKVEGDAGHAIVKSTDGSTYTYYALTGADSTYSGRNTSGQSITITPAGADLSVTISYGFGGTPVTYTRTSDLPAALEIEGTYKGADDWTSVTINFTDKTVEEEEATFENVGDYIVIKGQFTNYLVYKDGEKFYVVADDSTLELKKQGGGTEPQPTVDIEGVWTGDNIEITIDLDEGGETGHAVIKKGANYFYTALAKDGDHYTGTVNSQQATFTPTADGFTYVNSTTSETFTEKQDITPIALEGEYKEKSPNYGITIDFTEQTFEMSGAQGATFVTVGGYIVIQVSGASNPTFFVYQSEDKVFAYVDVMTETIELAANSQPQPQETEYTLKFWKEKDEDGTYEDSGNLVETKTVTLAKGAQIGESNIPTDTPKKAGYEFKGWYYSYKGTEVEVTAAFDPSNADYEEATTFNIWAKWDSTAPTVTVDKGDATGDGELTITPVLSGDTYEITFPENTVYTAPVGTYFRGYTYNGKTYFPTEKATGIEPKATVQITIVWQSLSQEVTEESVTLDKWNLVLTSGYIISKDEPVTIQGTYKETLGVVYAGLVAQIRAESGGDNLYFLRPDNAYCYDAAMTASWTTASEKVSTSGTFVGDGNKAEVKGVKWEFTLNTDTDTLIAKQTIYGDAGSNLGEGTYTITGMTADSYRVDFALDVGITSDDMKVTYHRHYNTPEAFKVGESEEVKTGFTGENVPWISLIKKGEKVVLTGTMKSTAGQNFHSALAYLWSSGNKPVRGIFRADNFVGDGKVDTDGNGTIDWQSDADQMANGANIKATEGWEIQMACANTKNDGDFWTNAKATFADCTLTITFDYTNESKIVITMAFVGVSNENTYTQTYTITAAADKALRDEYQIGLGGEEVFIDITSVELSHAAAE